MSTLCDLKRLLFGETWLLPVGIATVTVASLLIRPLLPNAWEHLGGFILLVGVLGVLVTSVVRTARGR
jgi:hypothetical protein